MKIGLISDTHGNLHPKVFQIFEGVDLILHAGDVVGEHILDELEIIAPVKAVTGNCDYPSSRLPLYQKVSTPFGNVIVTHSHAVQGGQGPSDRLITAFKDAKPRVIVYGHTHKEECRLVDDVWLVNPGPAGKPRFRDVPQVMTLEWNREGDSFIFDPTRLDWKNLEVGS
jgi:hypothetical protein